MLPICSGQVIATHIPSARRPRRPGSVAAMVYLQLALGFVLLVAGGEALVRGADRSREVKALGNCAGCAIKGRDFSDRRLMGLGLAGADLRGVAFDRAGLGIAVFDDAILVDVSFADADLRGTSFVGTRMTNVRFEGAIQESTDLQPGLLCNTQMPDDKMENSDCR